MVDLNEYRVEVRVFNNQITAQFDPYNTGYNQLFQNFDSYILDSVISYV